MINLRLFGLLAILLLRLPAAAADTSTKQNHLSSGTALSTEIAGIRLGEPQEEITAAYGDLASITAAKMGMAPIGPEDYASGGRGFELLTSPDDRFSAVDFWATPNSKKIFKVEAHFADPNLHYLDLVKTYTARLGKSRRKGPRCDATPQTCYTWADSKTMMYLAGIEDEMTATAMGPLASPYVGVIDLDMKKQAMREEKENKKKWEAIKKEHLENSLP